MKHEFYKIQIADAVDRCTDVSLLDLVLKLLLESTKAPTTPSPSALEVKTDENNQRDQRVHRAVPLRVLRAAEHSQANAGKMGTRRAELPGVCGGADCLQGAA